MKAKFSVFSMGCKVNQYEGQGIVKFLTERGFEASGELTKADYYIINTCSVTAEADKKSRQAVARALKLNPNAKVFVTGCSSQNNSEQFLQKDGVYYVGGTFGKIRFAEEIISLIEKQDFDKISYLHEMPLAYEDDIDPSVSATRASVKIQDGCNNFCSYCIVPYLRGRSRSRSLDSVVSEAKKMAELSREIVLTGINISDYGSDIGETLTGLTKSLRGLKARFRFGSLECGVITEQLLSSMKESDFCDHFHLSMQSGSDAVLKAMNRHYTSKEFLEKIDLIRSYFPDAGITTDVICGFPTETEEQFEETVNTVLTAKFSDMHIFPYSVRQGTAAAKLYKTLCPPAQMSIRVKRLEEIRDQNKRDFILSQIGKTARIYVEEQAEGGLNTGYTSNYLRAYTSAPVKSYLEHKIVSAYQDGVKCLTHHE